MRLFRSLRDSAGVALAAVALAALIGTPLLAQTTSASLTGIVNDAQGGALPGASVTLVSNSQGDSQTAVTDSKGGFSFSFVRPDSYTLKVTMNGFKTAARPNVIVNANDKFFAGTLTLEVGNISEEVSVTARVTELQANSGERSYTLESTAMKSIAVDGRSFFGLVQLVPGIVPNAGGDRSAATPGQVSGFTANGQRPNSNNMTVDGVANIDTGDNGGNMATTNIDAVAEFKVLTNAYQAEYGRAVGGQVQVVTKSGTQDFHGSAYWYGRRSDWNANSWTNKRLATPITPPESSRNDYGYTIGGPIFLPGKFNEDKKKLFFFFSQEFQRRNDPANEQVVRVPTLLERQGDFSQSVDNTGRLYPYIRDASTNLPCNASDTRGCYQDGGVIGRIPQNRLYQTGLNILKLYPEPNANRGNGLNYASQEPNVQPRREEIVRLDFHPSDNWHFTGRYMRNKDERDLPYGVTWAGAGGNIDTIDTKQVIPGYNWMVSTTGILNPTTSLEVSVGSAHNSLDIFTTNDNFTRSAAGLSDLPLLFPDAVQNDLIPQFDFNGGRVGGSAARIQFDRGPFKNFNTTYDALANLVKIRGSHSFKAGIYYQSSLKPQSPFASFNSLIDFVNDDTGNPNDTTHPYSNAATGVFRFYRQASKYALPEWSYKNLEWYLQDNWKATSKLTIDYGVRFYYLTPQWDTTLEASTFLPDQWDPANAPRLLTPVCIGAYPCESRPGDRRAMDPVLIASGTTPTMANTSPSTLIGRLVPGVGSRFNGSFQAGQGVDDTLSDGNAFRVSPRFGFVYDISGKQSTILRGGFGIFYDRPQGNMVFDQIANAPGTLQPQINNGTLQNFGAATVNTSSTPNLDGPLALTPTAFGFKPPKVYSWNLGVQKKLPAAFVFDLAYVGSESRDLLQQTQINAVPFGAKFEAQNQDRTRNPNSLPGATALPDDFLRPYQGYSGIRMWEYTAYSNYHALQTSLNRRFDKGLLLGVSYTWSKALGVTNDDFTAGRPNSSAEDVRRADYSYLNFDRPHNFVANLVYQTPKVASGVLGVLANEWQISGVYRWTSGTPYAIAFSIPGVGAGNLTGSDGNQNARIVVTGDPGKGWSSDPYAQINTAAFAPPQPGSEGFESARFFLHGPPINNLDFSLSKSFSVADKARLEFRIDAFNALNHTQFTGVNATANYSSLSATSANNLPNSTSNFNLNGFGSITGVRQPRQIQVMTRLSF